jgi:uncharacterized protein YlaI
MGRAGRRNNEVWKDGNKKCPACNVYKSVDYFGKDKSNKSSVTVYCKECKRKLDKKYQKKHGHCFYAMIKKLYGIDKVEYERKEIAQDNKCYICKEPDPFGKRLSVDHNHTTGAVRGLLCTRCNHLLGNAQEKPDVLQSAINYLQEFS